MHDKAFTLSVVVAAVIGAVSLVSARIDQLQMQETMQPVATKGLARDTDAPLATASPLDIDPRRMQAPAHDANMRDDAGLLPRARALKVSNAG